MNEREARELVNTVIQPRYEAELAKMIEGA